jgi:hypothetical protein
MKLCVPGNDVARPWKFRSTFFPVKRAICGMKLLKTFVQFWIVTSSEVYGLTFPYRKHLFFSVIPHTTAGLIGIAYEF